MKLEIEIKEDAQIDRIHLLEEYLASSPEWMDVVQDINLDIET